MARQEVSVIKTIRLRYIVSRNGNEMGWNKSYQKPGAAAKAWAMNAAIFWRTKTFADKPMTQADYDQVNQREARYYKKSLSIFKAMLK